jgi:2-dehydro-3-deoxygluconokinase
MSKIVTFGEIMLRLSPPDHEVFLQSPRFVATFGGAEANVAVSLANYGESVAFATALPPGELGDATIRELRKFGVETRHIRRSGERIGIYFTQKGSCARPSKVLYDRAGSAAASVRPGDFNWEAILEGVEWFHVTGVTPALSAGAAAVTLEALQVCERRGITVSCDLNYRKKLWKWGKPATEIMPRVVRLTDVLIANEEDCQMALGIQAEADVTSGSLDTEVYRALTAKVLAAFPRLRHVAVSLRESLSADHNEWSGILAGAEEFQVSRKYALTHIVDRIGGGDSFGAGLIHGLRTLGSPREALEFAVAASALKHTILGDFNQIKKQDVLNLLGGDASGRVQR